MGIKTTKEEGLKDKDKFTKRKTLIFQSCLLIIQTFS